MGMYDTLHDSEGKSWQTKAFGRALTDYHVGDTLDLSGSSFQVEVLGEGEQHSVPGFATVRDGVLTGISTERDFTLPLRDYFGKPERTRSATPSDAAVRVALTEWYRGMFGGGWTQEHETRMRAALRAAAAVDGRPES